VEVTFAASHILPGPGSLAGDLIAIAIGIVTFAILYWAINLFDRV
jgi:hypothetical protein